LFLSRKNSQSHLHCFFFFSHFNHLDSSLTTNGSPSIHFSRKQKMLVTIAFYIVMSFAFITNSIASPDLLTVRASTRGLKQRVRQVRSDPTLGMYYEQLHARDEIAPGAKAQIGTSNPSIGAGDVNNIAVEKPTMGIAGGALKTFSNRRRSDKQRRREAAERVGQRFTKRQDATPPKVEIGTSNPPIPSSQRNMMPEQDPAKGNGGPITPFAIRGRSLNDELNFFPSHLATRGRKGGEIELF
jgi:hypothetical protein